MAATSTEREQPRSCNFPARHISAPRPSAGRRAAGAPARPARPPGRATETNTCKWHSCCNNRSRPRPHSPHTRGSRPPQACRCVVVGRLACRCCGRSSCPHSPVGYAAVPAFFVASIFVSSTAVSAGQRPGRVTPPRSPDNAVWRGRAFMSFAVSDATPIMHTCAELAQAKITTHEIRTRDQKGLGRDGNKEPGSLAGAQSCRPGALRRAAGPTTSPRSKG